MSEVKENTVIIAGKEYNLVKKGLEQAEQVSQISKWLANYGMPVFDKLSTSTEIASNTQLFALILEGMSTDALVDLFSLITGCSKKTAKEEFDVGVLFDSIGVVWENQPGIQRLVNRFFSTQESESNSEED